ncbi:MAG: DUF4832 domain-containing protein [Roseiflexaceae bacterium]
MKQSARPNGAWYWLLLAIVVLASSAAPASIAQTGGATITITPTAIPLADAEIVNPMRGFYRWYGSEPIPQPRPAYDHYARFGWRQLEPARGQYDFSAIEQALQEAENAGAKFAFRIMSVNEFTSPVEVPSYLTQEAGGAYCTYNGAHVWVPAWDSPQFLARAQALMSALGARFNGDPRLGYYDMGIYGHWGEWHTEGLCTPPAGDATKRALVDMQVAAFPNTRILMNSGGKEVDAFVYALSKSPRIGIRVDSLCSPWFDSQFTESPQKLAAMQDRWKTAPIITEFYTWNPSGIALCDQQVSTWHIAAIANGSIGNWSSYTADQQAQILTIGKHAGYRFALNALTYLAEVPNNTLLPISSQWLNVGITPAYEPFAVTFELRPKDQTTVVWWALSRLDLEGFLPATEPQTINDQLYLSGRIPPGQYTLSLVVRDLTGYRAPLSLAITGGDASGRYLLGELTITPGPPGYDVFLPLTLR